MGTITAQEIVDDVEQTLYDETNVRWGETEMLGYLNNASKDIVRIKPDAYTKNASVIMIASETKNTIPADGIRLKRPVRNMGTNGSTKGPVITWANMDQLDKTDPDWHNATASATIIHFLQDVDDPKNFYVYPPQPAANMGYAEIIYFAIPADIAIGVAIPIDDIYRDPYYFYMLARAHTKETPEANKAKAGEYFALYKQALGEKSAAEGASDAGKYFS